MKPEKNLNCKETATGMKPFPNKKECLSPDWESEWERVKRMRKEHNPLIKGGQYRFFKPTYTPRYTETSMKRRTELSQKQFHL